MTLTMPSNTYLVVEAMNLHGEETSLSWNEFVFVCERFPSDCLSETVDDF